MSRLGSVVTKTTSTSSRSPSLSRVIAEAIVDITIPQMSGQWV